MRSALVIALFVGCTGSPTPPAEPQEGPVLERLGEPGPHPSVANPVSLDDFLPTLLDGVPAEPDRPGTGTSRTWTVSGRAVTVSLGPIDDVARTRASFDLLGKDVVARMHGRELRGLRVQGNPAQLARDLDPPWRADLSVVAANTYLVTVSVEPAASLDEPLHFAEQVDIGGMTRLALSQAAQRSTGP